ncbi:Aspyridones efflux protein apdF [Psilocybe cubensis]|uniref:Major facilitator superfamily (MFS) profile domain-containing protein n=2 Tax=Psilocybe cubensis TaxID=181762 RepID=A0A8H7XQH9_PSICU|nr:Aspyridones efflux protein apdF [Psilocybe cubensis]KAH9475572.1 Aspyridones efflux protein apdF [Psilocybe cubensis]
MRDSEAVFKEPKYALSNASTVGDIPQGEIPLPQGLPIPEGGFKILQQPKFALSNASTVGSPFPGSGFKVEVEPAVPLPPKPVTELPFPEGGLAGWATALGAFLIQFCGFGYSTSYGVFQDFYVREYLTKESSSAIAWIGSINAFLVISGGLLAGRIYDRGHFYALLWGGSTLISFSLFMLSLTKENHYYQILLSQGFGVGIGIGMIYVPSVAILSHYFRRRRNLVMTVVAAGSSLGAVVHPIMLNNTIPKIGFAKATRANAGLVSGLLFVACLIMRTRLPPPSSTPDLRKSLIKFSKDKAYICCTLGFFFFIIGFYYPIFYLQLDSITHHLSPNFAFYSLVVMNGSSFMGRIFAGFTGGAIGIGNLVVISTAICSILIFCMIFISSVASVVIIAIIYGFSSGAYVALMAPMVANLADDFSEIGLRMGIGFTLAGFGGLVGTPIEGALLTSRYIWWRPTVFSGVMATTGCIMYIGMVLFLKQKKKRQAAAKDIVLGSIKAAA